MAKSCEEEREGELDREWQRKGECGSRSRSEALLQLSMCVNLGICKLQTNFNYRYPRDTPGRQPEMDLQFAIYLSKCG